MYTNLGATYSKYPYDEPNPILNDDKLWEAIDDWGRESNDDEED